MLHPDSRAKAHHILLENQQACLDLKPLIHNLEDFMALAKQHSLCPSAKIGGDLGLTKPGVIVSELEKAIFEAPMESVVGPIKSVHGYHLLWIKKRHFADSSG